MAAELDPRMLGVLNTKGGLFSQHWLWKLVRAVRVS
jgi:hypothetical protein